MLEKPNLSDEEIKACLQRDYGLRVAYVHFLPLGVDVNAAVYRVVTTDSGDYFVKLRRGVFDEVMPTLPKFLADQGFAHIIAPIVTMHGLLWAEVGAFKLILYPFVEGRNAYEAILTERHWADFGATLKRLHTTIVPLALAARIQRETYSPQWRDMVKRFLQQAAHDTFADPSAAALAIFLNDKRDVILDMLARADQLAQVLQTQSLPLVLCHADAHAGNILVGVNEALYVVDWDAPIFAPKERDLMFVGSGLGFAGHTAQHEEALFYHGYGLTEINYVALAYYRYERIIEDLAAFCQQLFLSAKGGDDRAQALRYVMFNFLPNSTIAMARVADARIMHEDLRRFLS